ncbi:MAG: SUMF1/EgtB/PvdO family nonheme iron enzyme [Phycisphaerales bacterium]|nr:SUMF1/EgtB/PvdO family nonheme iron enzyme [Phycisphaerales bacterium]
MKVRIELQRIQLGFMIAGVCAGGALSQGDADFGFDFVTIGDPGNRDTTPEESTFSEFNFQGPIMGGVDYEFRMARLELTVEQHFEFVVAYLPFYEKRTGHVFGFSFFVGDGIRTAFGVASIREGISLNRPSDMSWEYLARYVNWLHHGKVVEAWAFDSGVYDTSTFTQNDDGTWNHQAAHNPEARYWIPTLDEWVKAAHWDPDKDNGMGGYWIFQNSSDIEPIPGLLPSEGGERNAGDEGFPLDVGSFPDVISPWGMLDMAGGIDEFTETPVEGRGLFTRRMKGTVYFDDLYGFDMSRDILGVAREGAVVLCGTLRLTTGLFHPADLNQDGQVNYFDISMFIRLFAAGDERADFRLDGAFDIDDVRVFLGLMSGSA